AFGGFIGDVQGGKISIKESFATGSISNIQFTGGLIGLAGQAPSGTIDIVDSYAQVAVNSASQYAGGLIGGALAGTINLANVYAAAPVKSQSSAGGIVGSLINSALLATESYYDKQITGTNNSGDFYSIGLNTSQMKAGPQNPAFVFGNWNQEIWDFQQGYYPTRP
ncbi:MAG TPA: hypothetical protein VI522_03435, partial [Gammaproteobacteria bacterium]|nr:hypothetical protein [Gammaproteobacteria bacterium]